MEAQSSRSNPPQKFPVDPRLRCDFVGVYLRGVCIYISHTPDSAFTLRFLFLCLIFAPFPTSSHFSVPFPPLCCHHMPRIIQRLFLKSKKAALQVKLTYFCQREFLSGISRCTAPVIIWLYLFIKKMPFLEIFNHCCIFLEIVRDFFTLSFPPSDDPPSPISSHPLGHQRKPLDK